MPGIALNEDCSHYFISRADSKLDAEAVASWVDQYAGTQITELVMNPNGMRTSYASEAWEPIWTGTDPEGGLDQPSLCTCDNPEIDMKWIRTAWQLHQAGLDVYKIWIDRAREKGISPWISMRMNDVHCVNDEQRFIHSDYWRSNPQLRRVHHKFDRWPDKALDYAQPAVREHSMNLVREFVERYDFDGLELDWMRFGYHFGYGHEEEHASILTQFMADVRRMLNDKEQSRGHKIKLGVRVPARPDVALWLGMDAVEWARRGLVDKIVPCPFFDTIDTDIPIEIWKKLLDGTNVTLAAGLELFIRPYWKIIEKNSLETIRGAAKSCLDRGADQVYLFNYMDCDTTINDEDEYRKIMHEIGDMSTLSDKPRRHVVTYTDMRAIGEMITSALPAELGSDEWRAFRVHIGRKPESGRLRVLLGIENGVANIDNAITVTLNGEPCEFAGVADIKKPSPSFPVYVFDVDLDKVSNGYNIIDVHSSETVTLGWVEIAVDPTAPIWRRNPR